MRRSGVWLVKTCCKPGREEDSTKASHLCLMATDLLSVGDSASLPSAVTLIDLEADEAFGLLRISESSKSITHLTNRFNYCILEV